MGALRDKYKPKEKNIIKLKKYLALVEKNKNKSKWVTDLYTLLVIGVIQMKPMDGGLYTLLMQMVRV